MTNETLIQPGENPAETMRKVMTDLAKIETISVPSIAKDGISAPYIVAKPDGRRLEDLSTAHLKAMEHFKPTRRRGIARMQSLASLILWADRFKNEDSALFADANMKAPSLTCIADYHAAGPAAPEGIDPTARHMAHRAIYDFPLSEDWKAWMKVSGQALDKDEMGEFIEAQAKDFMDPTPAILKNAESEKNEAWENRLIQTAQKIEGRFGQLGQLLAMSKRFQVYETSDLKMVTNRDTGEAEIQFLNEHKDETGAKLNIPNLMIIAIPVFENGAPYRMSVRLRYRKSGATVKFILTIYNPEKVFQDAFDQAVSEAEEKTGLPLFLGKPEVRD